MAAPKPATTSSGVIKMTDQESAYLNSFLRAGDRGGFYLAYYNMTGSTQAIVQSKVSTFSEELGGSAYVANVLLQSTFGPKGNYAGIYNLSQKVAQSGFDAINSDRARPEGTGEISSDALFNSARAAWIREGQTAQFPGNIFNWADFAKTLVYADPVTRLRAEIEQFHQISEGLIAAGTYSVAALQQAVNPGVRAALLATVGASVVGKGLADFQNRAGYSIQQVPDGSLQVAIESATGKVVGVFNNTFLPLPSLELIGERLLAYSSRVTWGNKLPVLRDYLLDLRLHLTESSQPYNGDNQALNSKPANPAFGSLTAKPALLATAGSDTLWASPFKTVVNGGGGDDFMFGGAGGEQLFGEAGADVLIGGDGGDKLFGGEGNDTVRGGAGDDTLEGGDGDDILDGGDIRLDQTTGTDTLIGGKGDDFLSGGDGTDWLRGEEGADMLVGGADSDRLDGGKNFDTFSAGRLDTLIDDEKGEGRVYFADLKNLLVSGGSKVKPEDGETFVTWIGGGLGFRREPSTDTLGIYRKVDNVWTSWASVQNYFKLASYMSVNGEEYHYLGITLSSKNPPGTPGGGPAPAPSWQNSMQFTQALMGSPIVLDLDGDGVETVGQQANVHFDHDGNLRGELSAWAGADDGLLAYDRNGDGLISSGAELFGDRTPLPTGGTAEHGFVALKALDSNADGQMTSADALYSKLKVWRDTNLNGESEVWELSSLADLKITSIATASTASTFVDAAGNAHAQVGSFTINGQTRTATDVWFTVDRARTTELDQRPLAADVQALPQVKAFGQVHDMRQTMAVNPALKGLVQQFVSATDAAARNALLDPIILQWAGTAAVDPVSRGPEIDARYLEAMEKLIGAPFAVAWERNPWSQSATIIMDEYRSFRNHVRSQLMAQSHYKNEFDLLQVKFDDAKGEFVADLAALKTNLKALATAGNTAKVTDIYQTLRGLDLYEGFMPTQYQSILLDPQLTTYAVMPASFIGTTGADSFQGNASDNDFHGKTGNDYASGGEGNDVYRYGLGDGADTIYDPTGKDSLVFLPGITPNRVRAVVGNPGVLLEVLDAAGLPTGQQINYYSFAYSNDWGLESIYFADGTVWTDAQIKKFMLLGTERSENLYGYETDDFMTGKLGNDSFWGREGNDRIEGGEGNDYVLAGAGADSVDGGTGNDRIYGEAGNDTLSGGANDDLLYGEDGNDTLAGDAGTDTLDAGAGSDTYVFGRGGGQDRITHNDAGIGKIDAIRFDATVKPADVVASMDGLSLKLAIAGTTDSITVTNYFYDRTTNNPYKVEEVRFADNTVWNLATIRQKALLGTPGADTIYGFNDTANTIDGGDGNDMLYGGALNDALSGGNGDDNVSGERGNDTLAGGAGNDVLYGDEGNDVYRFGRGGGQDRIQQYDYYDSETDVLIFDSNIAPSDVRASNEGDWLKLSIIGTTDSIVVSEQFSEWNATQARIEQVRFASGTVWDWTALRQMVLTGSSGNDVIRAFDTNDSIVGGAGDDSLYGGYGNDTLTGGAGNDHLYGQEGSDTYVFGRGSGQDVVHLPDYWERQSDPSGSDTILFGPGVLAGDVVFSGDYSVTIKGTADRLAIENPWYGGLGGFRFADGTVVGYGDFYAGGSSYGNPVNATDANSLISGGDSNDLLNGFGGNDLIDGAAGADTMNGGLGNDILVVDNAGDVVIEALNQGTDTVQSFVGYTLGANVENLALLGTASINATGNAGNNVVLGNSGNNVLNGLAGGDTMRGGGGNDTYVVDSAADVVVENANEGTDTVQSAVTATLAANVENLLLTGAAAVNGTGNNLDNALTGNSATNILAGRAGNDTYYIDAAVDIVTENLNEGIDTVQSAIAYTLGANLENLTLTGTAAVNGAGNGGDNVLTGNSANNLLTGNAGNDTLDGRAGIDALTGGLGNDTYVVDVAGDVVTENLNEGTDTVQSAFSYALGANVENLTLTGAAVINATGNGLNNILRGNSANNVLDGGAGADAMLGGGGHDTYVVDNAGDVVTEILNEGADVVQSAVSYTLGANIENLTLTGAAAINGIGNTLDNVLTGNSANNVLSALAGNDTLNGGAGADTMSGGAGNDSYVVDQAGDAVTENLNEGADTVQSAVTYTLGANVEHLTLTGAGAINGAGNASDNTLIGNALANVLTGNAGNDTLDGAAGADSLVGGNGNDTYVVADAGDAVTEYVNEGTDRVLSAVSHSLAANVENLLLTGAAVINGFGNGLDNTIEGNNAANALSGGGGNDTLRGFGGADSMSGGLGNDAYAVQDASDVVTENMNEGTDSVWSSIASYTLGANVENLYLSGAALTGIGNALNNMLTGSALDNALDGAGGADTMIVGGGHDAYTVDNVGDIVTEIASAGIDTVKSAITYTLGANVENLVLTGIGAINGSGNTLDNTLTGNAANNLLTGNAGNDTLNGGVGGDGLSGGLGNDIYVVDSSLDVVTENLNEGVDTVQSSLGYTLGVNVENLSLIGSAAVNGAGNELANVLRGNAAGNVIDGRAGADSMLGGGGDDVYVVDNAADVVTENANEGSDTIQSSVTYTLAANVERLTLTGAAAIGGVGNALDNVITGNAAANALAGMAGNDTYVVDHAGDAVSEVLNAGNDSVQSSVTHTLAANVENLVLTAAAATNGTGNALDNALTGNAANNILTGLAGNDTLHGGAGADTMIGGAGNDLYVVDNVGDVITENLNEGVDTVQSSLAFALAATIEHLTLTGNAAVNGTGNGLDNVLTGNAASNTLTGAGGNDTLNGGAGIDTMIGGAGNDLYVVGEAGDVVTELANEGTDTVQSAITYTLGSTLEHLTLTGSAAVNATGNNFDNTLIGNAGANILTAGIGNDTLDGGAGIDTLVGGVGNDIYLVDNAADLVTEAVNEGTDTVRSGVTYTLGATLEHLTLTGSAAINAIGNNLDNTLTGNAAANTLTGGAGNDSLDGGAGVDTLIGGLGNDVYFANSQYDIVRENVGEGFDTIFSSDYFYQVAANVEKLVMTAMTGGRANGTGGDDWLVGGSGADTLFGFDGNDLLTGGAGDDYFSGYGGNQIHEGMDGNDQIWDRYGNNLLSGGAGNDNLNADYWGHDFYLGGKGADYIDTGNGGADIIAFNRGDGADWVYSDDGVADNTLTLGGGIRYSDMTFSRDAYSLTLNLGGSDKIELSYWYYGAQYKSVLNMQVIVDATADFNAASTNKLVNKKVANFDFQGLVAAYDAAGAPANWALTNALLSKHLSGSDTAALGGDLAYRYGKSGSLAGMGFDPVQGILGNASFGTASQTLQSAATLDTGLKRLS